MIEITMKCDAYGCCNSFDLTEDDLDNVNETLDNVGWFQDPNESEFHYCDRCWSQVQVELEAEQR